MPNGAGGGGGGGTIVGVGNSFTGPSTALELVGNHAYAYANAVSSTSSQTLLDFTSGNYYFVGELEFNPQVEYANQGVGSLSCVRVKMNGALVALLTTESTDFYRSSMKIIIPAYTVVTVEAIGGSADPQQILTIALTGRIYRG